jgi:CRP/FNR family transcriptional regulator, cyclic AMP receptor protein
VFRKFGKRKLGKTYNKGDVIFKQGDTGTSLYKVDDGEVALIVEMEKALYLIAGLGKGEIFGISHLFGETVRFCSALAKKDNTTIIKLDKKVILKMMHVDPSFSYKISEILSKRLMGITVNRPCECNLDGVCIKQLRK